MKLIKLTLVALVLTLAKGSLFAQVIDDPTTWTYEVKKKSATDYQLIFHLNIKSGWHIWSMNPGGDGYEIAPSFTFDKNVNVKLKGATTEKGKATTTKMEGIDGKITYLAGKIDYTQEVTVAGASRITGKHTYQVCSDKLCLPPTDKDFVFEIK